MLRYRAVQSVPLWYRTLHPEGADRGMLSFNVSEKLFTNWLVTELWIVFSEIATELHPDMLDEIEHVPHIVATAGNKNLRDQIYPIC